MSFSLKKTIKFYQMYVVKQKIVISFSLKKNRKSNYMYIIKPKNYKVFIMENITMS